MSSTLSPELAGKRVSAVRCQSCGYEFNFAYSWYGSLTARRAGRAWVFKCPSCGLRGEFDLGRRGYDPALPTYVDQEQRTYNLVLAGFLAMVVLTIATLWYELPAGYRQLAFTPLPPDFIIFSLIALLARSTAKIQRWQPPQNPKQTKNIRKRSSSPQRRLHENFR